jgi:hypothetical protein
VSGSAWLVSALTPPGLRFRFPPDEGISLTRRGRSPGTNDNSAGHAGAAAAVRGKQASRNTSDALLRLVPSRRRVGVGGDGRSPAEGGARDFNVIAAT